MNWLATGSCEAITNFSWLVGALGGVLLDAFLLIAIAQTPHLREHGGEADPIGFAERWILPLPPYLIALLWFWGLHHVGGELLHCYAFYNAIAAVIVVGLLMLVLIPIAARQIAARSIW